MIALRPAVCAVVACLAATPAFAGPIAATFGTTIEMWFDGVHPGDGGAGMYNWTSHANYAGLVYADPTGNRFVTFCIERTQDIGSGWRPYTIVPLEGAPNPGPHMSHATADALRGLWAQYFAGVNTADEAAAFQNAVWHLVSNGGYTPSLTSGQRGYYNDYINPANWRSGLGSLAVLSSDGHQDQLVQVTPGFGNVGPDPVPEPGLLALGLLVLPAMMLRRRLAKA